MINYPHHKRKTNKKNENINYKNHSRRGMILENEIDLSNKYYLENGIANIHKKPTPIQVVKVDYPQRSAARIVEAYYKTPSTTDYNGVYKGYYLDFEAKQTNLKSKFVFANIHAHQIKHLQSVIQHGGIAFFIVQFTKLNETFLVDASIILEYYHSGIKSLSYEEFKNQGYELKSSYNPRIDYLAAVDLLISKR